MNQTTATKPETFMLSVDQLDNLPIEAKQALEQVDDVSTPLNSGSFQGSDQS